MPRMVRCGPRQINAVGKFSPIPVVRTDHGVTIWSPHTPQRQKLVPIAERHSPQPETCPHLFRAPQVIAGGLLPINALLFTDATVRRFVATNPLPASNIGLGSRHIAPSFSGGS